jgi:glyoxylase-like metal-dependent hydrolase (beta-lactamase superfamily II)
MRLDQVSDRVYANCDEETGGNVGVILMEDSVAAVDAQYPVSGADFRRSIPAVTAKPVTHLLLTHIHGDHVFGNQAFEDCEIVSHRRLQEKMEENLENEWAPENLERMLEDIRENRPERAFLFEGLRIVLPTSTYDERYTLDGIEVLYLPGHTDGSAVIYIPEDRILFAGDLLFAKTFPWAGDPTADPDEWIDSFKVILGMDVDIIVPGHGPVCDKGEIEIQLEWFKAARGEMRRLISEGVTQEEAVNHGGYPDFYESPGDRRERSLHHWYRFWKREMA